MLWLSLSLCPSRSHKEVSKQDLEGILNALVELEWATHVPWEGGSPPGPQVYLAGMENLSVIRVPGLVAC